MSFSKVLFTEKGRALQAKSVAGAALHFTKISMGSGSLGSQSQITLNGLIEPKVTIPILGIERNINYATIKGIFDNQSISTGFYWRELGVFAEDPNIGEILYCYGNAGALAEYIPSQSSQIIEKTISIPVIVGDAVNVTAQLDPLGYATKAEVSDKWEIFISESLPEVSERKEKTLYFKVTDTVSQGTNSNIVVSPTMGLKIEK